MKFTRNVLILITILQFFTSLAFGETQSYSPSKETTLRWIKKNRFKLSNEKLERLLESTKIILNESFVQKDIEKNRFFPFICQGVNISIIFVTSESSTCYLLNGDHQLNDSKLFRQSKFKLQHSGYGYNFLIMGGALIHTFGAIITDDTPDKILGHYSDGIFQATSDEAGFNDRWPINPPEDSELTVINNGKVEKLITIKLQRGVNIGIFYGDARIVPYKDN